MTLRIINIKRGIKINKFINWAIVPARSGSKGLKNKNIKSLGGIPLIAHAINFALNSNKFERVLVSTDSIEYASIAESYGAWVPFLRSMNCSLDNSMEEEVLADLDIKLEEKNIKKPDIITWLRPTFPFRSTKDLEEGLHLLTEKVDSVRFVSESDPRIFSIKNNLLKPIMHTDTRSMIRRQEMSKTYNVYHTDIFWYKNIKYGERFLGTKSVPYILEKICAVDIDTINDFVIAEILIKSKLDALKEYINLKRVSS